MTEAIIFSPTPPQIQLDGMHPDMNSTTGDNYSSRGEMYNETDYNTALFYFYLWTKVTPSIFGLIILIGTLGNSLVIYVIISRRKMRTVTNILLLNLAMSDIAFLLICVPFQAYKYASFRWPFGNLSCKIVQYFLFVTAYVTVWTLTSISATRFMIVIYSNQTARFRTKRNISLLCVFIWIIMLVVNIPIILVHRINQVNDYTYCGLNPDYTATIIISFFVCAYAVPLALICLLYMMIILHLRANGTTMLTSSKNRTARACKVIIIVVVVFCLCWAPNHINSLLGLFNKIPMTAYYEAFRVLSHCMAYGNSIANPFIYNYASEEFRKAFKEIFCCKCNHYEGGKKDFSSKRKTYTTDDGALTTERQSMMKTNGKQYETTELSDPP